MNPAVWSDFMPLLAVAPFMLLNIAATIITAPAGFVSSGFVLWLRLDPGAGGRTDP